MRKKIMAAFLSLACVAGTVPIAVLASASTDPISIEAETPIGISPMWINLQQITLGMSYSSGKVNWTGNLTSYTTASKMTANFTLQKQNTNGTYSTVATWSGFSTTSIILACSSSYTGSQGTYKLIVNATITSKSGAVENVTNSLIKTV